MIETLKSRARVLKREVFVLMVAMRDPQTPWTARMMGTLVIAYACSPIDLIPDFIPVFGLLDDLILVPAGIVLTLRLVPAPVLERARLRADELMAVGKPVNRTAGLMIVVVWVLLAVWLGSLAWRMLTP